MQRLLFHTCPQGKSSKRATAARAFAQVKTSHYRRATFEQLEERRAMASVTLGGPVTHFYENAPQEHFEAAAFPQVVQLTFPPGLRLAESSSSNAAIVPPLLLTRQQDPVRVLPLANSRWFLSSIDRIQATAPVETNVDLRRGPIAQQATASKATERAPQDHKSIAATESPTRTRRILEATSPPAPGDVTVPTDLLLPSLSRSKVTPAEPTSDGREYLTGVTTIILTAAAVAAALVLPGIFSEIRRRRKHALPQIARAPEQSSQVKDTVNEHSPETYPIRERAG